jgi:dienelactone hydrolase
MSRSPPHLAGFEPYPFRNEGIEHAVYRGGQPSDPALLLMCELAGFAPGLLAMAERLIEAGYQVHLPWLFGPFGRRAPLRNALRLCISREFARLRAGVSAPITVWLRALAAHISSTQDGRPVGAVGMCLTGAFAIPLIIEPAVVAAVAAQPSVPIDWRHLLLGSAPVPASRALNVDDADIAAARARLEDGGAHLYACRFRADRLCPGRRMEHLQDTFPIGLTCQEYATPEWRNALGRRAHATFTKEYRIAPKDDPEHPSRVAWRDLLAFLDRHLRG